MPPAKTHDQVIGTYNGYVWHQNHGEPSCGPCRRAMNIWSRERHLAGKCEPGLGWPLAPRARSNRKRMPRGNSKPRKRIEIPYTGRL